MPSSSSAPSSSSSSSADDGDDVDLRRRRGDDAPPLFLDITDLVRLCASSCLSPSLPFVPRSSSPSSSSGRRGGWRPPPPSSSSLWNDDDGDCDGCGDLGGEEEDDDGGDDYRGNGDDAADGTMIDPPPRANNNDDGAATKSNDGGGGGRLRRPPPPIGGTTPTLCLLDAMTALEVGDGRTDCCEIPIRLRPPPGPSSATTTTANDCSPGPPRAMETSATSAAAPPPRIAPRDLSDGTPPMMPSSSHPASPSHPPSPPSGADGATVLPVLPVLVAPEESPCPSLLPHWNSLLPSSDDSLLSLLLLQLVALEAYVGTGNGGSTAAETLYCVTWLHDGVLVDMAERLGARGDDVGAVVDALSAANEGGGGDDDGAVIDGNVDGHDDDDDDYVGTVARWVLFASSLGAVRIAESVRSIVVSADFYEEEDFGVAMHGRSGGGTTDDNGDDEGGGDYYGENDDIRSSSSMIDETRNDGAIGGGPSSSVRFCPALVGGARHCEVVWDAALLALRRYRASSRASAARRRKGGDDDDDDDDDDEDGAKGEKTSATIEAFETIIRLQQSFYRALQILSNLRPDTVRDFARIAVERSRETAGLLATLRDNDAVAEISRRGLIGRDGTLIDRHVPGLNALLAASFDPHVNRRLLGSAPARRARFRDPRDALSSLEDMASELEWGVCDLILHGDSLGRIFTMLENNSLRGCGGVVPPPPPPPPAPAAPPAKDPPPSGGGSGVRQHAEAPIGMNILSRSLVVLNLYFDDMLFGQYDFSDMVGKSLPTRESNVLSTVFYPVSRTPEQKFP